MVVCFRLSAPKVPLEPREGTFRLSVTPVAADEVDLDVSEPSVGPLRPPGRSAHSPTGQSVEDTRGPRRGQSRVGSTREDPPTARDVRPPPLCPLGLGSQRRLRPARAPPAPRRFASLRPAEEERPASYFAQTRPVQHRSAQLTAARSRKV